MPSKLFPALLAGRRAKARGTGVRRRTLRTLVLSGLVLGLLVPGTAVRAEPSLAEIQKKIHSAGEALEKVVEDYNAVKEDMKKTNAAAKKHAAELPALQVRFAEARAEVSAIAATAYKRGQMREVNALLEGPKDNSLMNRISTLDQLARGQQAELDEYTRVKQQYDAEKLRLDNALAKQKIQARELEARKKKVEKDLKKLYAMRRDAYGSEQESGSRYSGNIPANAPTAVRYAYNAIGANYVWGAAGPYSAGYDCSGLTSAAWASAGKSLPHSAASQYNVTGRISRSQLQPGDLVFYSGLGHVAIYVGGGQVIHAPQAGETVKLASVDMMPPYGYGRVR